MSELTFDTHEVIKNLKESGIPEAQAEAVSSAIKAAQDNQIGDLATKKNLIDLHKDMVEVKMELKTEITDLKGKITLMQWMLAFLLLLLTWPFIRELLTAPAP